MNFEREIKRYRDLQSLATLMKYAPTLSRKIHHKLEKLELLRIVASIAREEVNGLRSEIKEEILRLSLSLGDKTTEKSFLVSTLFLGESFHYLSRQPEESLHFASGSTHDGCITVNFFLPVKLGHATVVGAEADRRSLFQAFSTLENMGHSLTGVFHIHPGSGPASIDPSGTDRAYMKRLKGRAVVFGIWSRDAWLRLISLSAEHEIQFQGEGIKEIERNEREVVCKLERRLRRSLLGLD